ncbi:MmcQ/YjbR family DNA-binding protein [Microbacterium hydrocarbonoxydans]|uniref:Predicted DNA-binding protein, MmcQ/YjbR family n=1 Tax=Microbacterium hydrocarbonoxydans TaxID=273678 RepID=A0A1H4K3F1_9MICO|nr:MmcQ/YjbR family DNA-binding protein [Microbacterium hydrocarbonoxydans]SEB52816.1 Predicted DNA-binding protein, MmcQ/YjbR family [Microbacterium hydrocarbonoxydans]
MDPTQLVATATSRAEELPGAVRENPFGPEWDVYKVRGRVFLLVPLDGTGRVTLKSHPDDSVALRETFADIVPGYHMNKKHWITLLPGSSLEDELVTELVTESYLLVVEKLPLAQRPVDPQLFARPAPEQTGAQ